MTLAESNKVVNMSISRNVSRTTQAAPVALGRSVQRLLHWRERLQAAQGNITYRQVALRTTVHGKGGETANLSHTTVRSVLMGPQQSIQLDTLAAICDALNVDILQIIGGENVTETVLPAGAALPKLPPIAIIPILPLPMAHMRDKMLAQPDNAKECLYLPAPEAKGLLAARVVDDSMAPTYQRGDVVMYKPGKPASGDAVLVEVDGYGVTLLRRWKPTRDGKVRLDGDNADFGSTTTTEKMAHVVGVVCGHMHRDG